VTGPTSRDRSPVAAHRAVVRGERGVARSSAVDRASASACWSSWPGGGSVPRVGRRSRRRSDRLRCRPPCSRTSLPVRPRSGRGKVDCSSRRRTVGEVGPARPAGPARGPRRGSARSRCRSVGRPSPKLPWRRASRGPGRGPPTGPTPGAPRRLAGRGRTPPPATGTRPTPSGRAPSSLAGRRPRYGVAAGRRAGGGPGTAGRRQTVARPGRQPARRPAPPRTSGPGSPG
jgi:hypothetical protein